jgi:hypothetical protein
LFGPLLFKSLLELDEVHTDQRRLRSHAAILKDFIRHCARSESQYLHNLTFRIEDLDLSIKIPPKLSCMDDCLDQSAVVDGFIEHSFTEKVDASLNAYWPDLENQRHVFIKALIDIELQDVFTFLLPDLSLSSNLWDR